MIKLIKLSSDYFRTISAKCIERNRLTAQKGKVCERKPQVVFKWEF